MSCRLGDEIVGCPVDGDDMKASYCSFDEEGCSRVRENRAQGTNRYSPSRSRSRRKEVSTIDQEFDGRSYINSAHALQVTRRLIASRAFVRPVKGALTDYLTPEQRSLFGTFPQDIPVDTEPTPATNHLRMLRRAVSLCDGPLFLRTLDTINHLL
jgi:hypothetical protein